MIPKLSHNAPLVAVMAVSSIMFLAGLGQNTLANWDEAWYADATRHMFREDHFMTPVWNGQYFFDKPPLQYWLTQTFIYWLGEAELAYRLPSALAGIGLVGVVFLWGRRRWGAAGGVIAAVALLSFPHFLDRGRSGNFDALFVFWTTLSLFLFSANKSLPAGVALGLAWMTKGVFSGLFPVAVGVGFLLVDLARRRSARLLVPLAVYVGGALAVYAPWHLLELSRFEDLIDRSYFATFDQGEFGGGSWMDIAWRFDLRYLVFLWTFLRGWFPVLLAAAGWAAWKWEQALRRQFLPLAAFAVIFLALSSAKAKNDWYIMPAYPFAALMITDFVMGVSRRRRTWAVGGVILFAAVNLGIYRFQAFPPDRHLPERQLAEYVRSVTAPEELVVTAEYEFPTMIYYSQREVRTVARQRDYEGKYWWIWDQTDIATALRRGRLIVTVHRPGTEWSLDVPGYQRVPVGEAQGRILSRYRPL